MNWKIRHPELDSGSLYLKGTEMLNQVQHDRENII